MRSGPGIGSVTERDPRQHQMWIAPSINRSRPSEQLHIPRVEAGEVDVASVSDTAATANEHNVYDYEQGTMRVSTPIHMPNPRSLPSQPLPSNVCEPWIRGTYLDEVIG